MIPSQCILCRSNCDKLKICSLWLFIWIEWLIHWFIESNTMFYTNVSVFLYYKFHCMVYQNSIAYSIQHHGVVYRQYNEIHFIEILCFQRKQYFSLLTLSRKVSIMSSKTFQLKWVMEKKLSLLHESPFAKISKNVGHNVRNSVTSCGIFSMGYYVDVTSKL